MQKQVKSQRAGRNIVKGQVVSDKGDKTISVLIYRLMKHPKYKKYIRKKSVFRAHDAENKAKKGDIVKIYETRPVSKTKRWNLLEVLESSIKTRTHAEEDLHLDPVLDSKAKEESVVGTEEKEVSVNTEEKGSAVQGERAQEES